MNTGEHIKRLEAQRAAAMIAGDVETIATMLDPDLVYVHSTGVRDSRDTYLQALRDGEHIYENFQIKQSSCIETTDAVIVSSIVNMRVRRKDQANAVAKELSVLSVWRASGNGWLLVALQATTSG